jgi:hypothetical protein
MDDEAQTYTSPKWHSSNTRAVRRKDAGRPRNKAKREEEQSKGGFERMAAS